MTESYEGLTPIIPARLIDTGRMVLGTYATPELVETWALLSMTLPRQRAVCAEVALARAKVPSLDRLRGMDSTAVAREYPTFQTTLVATAREAVEAYRALTLGEGFLHDEALSTVHAEDTRPRGGWLYPTGLHTLHFAAGHGPADDYDGHAAVIAATAATVAEMPGGDAHLAVLDLTGMLCPEEMREMIGGMVESSEISAPLSLPFYSPWEAVGQVEAGTDLLVLGADILVADPPRPENLADLLDRADRGSVVLAGLADEHLRERAVVSRSPVSLTLGTDFETLRPVRDARGGIVRGGVNI